MTEASGTRADSHTGGYDLLQTGTVGTAAEYRVQDADGTTVWSGTDVGTSGNELVLSTTSISSGQSIDLTACQFTQPVS